MYVYTYEYMCANVRAYELLFHNLKCPRSIWNMLMVHMCLLTCGRVNETMDVTNSRPSLRTAACLVVEDVRVCKVQNL